MTEKDYLDLCIQRGYKYDSNTGLVYGSNNKPLLRKSNTGYYRFCIRIGKGQKSILSHRFAWYYAHREVPLVIDHIDGDVLNNKLSNLRDVTLSINALNKVKCAYQYNEGRSKPWVVTFKKKYIGDFLSEQEAKEFSTKYKIEYFKSIGLEFTR